MLKLVHIQKPEFKALLRKLKAADQNHKATEAEFLPKYNELLFSEVSKYYGTDFNADNNTLQDDCGDDYQLTWNTLYLLENEELLKNIYNRMDSVVKESGYDLEPGYCPILISSNKITDVYAEFRAYLGKIDSTYEDISLHYNINKKFEAITLDMAYKQK